MKKNTIYDRITLSRDYLYCESVVDQLLISKNFQVFYFLYFSLEIIYKTFLNFSFYKLKINGNYIVYDICKLY